MNILEPDKRYRIAAITGGGWVEVTGDADLAAVVVRCAKTWGVLNVRMLPAKWRLYWTLPMSRETFHANYYDGHEVLKAYLYAARFAINLKLEEIKQ
jgi:hypothetical protein